MENARFNPQDYPWCLPDFTYGWVFIVPGDWDPIHYAGETTYKKIWEESEFSEIVYWLKEHCLGDFFVEQNTSDGVITPVEVHMRGLRNARRFAVTWCV